MGNKKCEGCSQRKACQDSLTSWAFFLVGIIATVALRVIVVVEEIDPAYGRVAWYVGVIGFILFFVYKFRLLRESAAIIKKSGLRRKIAQEKELGRRDYVLLGELVCAQDNWKERMNFFIIFLLSGLALLFAIYLDFFD